MIIRRAKEADIKRIMELLGQVLEIHASIRPDIFVSGTTKYSEDDLREMIQDDEKPIFVAADDRDCCMGYAFCQLKNPAFTSTMVPHKSLYIDDLCVDEKYRGEHVGEKLFEYVKGVAKKLGCYEVTLCVWNGNDTAEHFYEKMGMTTKERVMEIILE
jgi:ribosomal protein S18 acetylase RimI-like enzyme